MFTANARGAGHWTVLAMTTNTATMERFLTIPQLVERWPIGRTRVYDLVKTADFPKGLVLLRDKNGMARSTGFRLSDIEAYEASRMVHFSGLDAEELAALASDIELFEGTEASASVADVEPDPGPAVSLPPAKKAQPRRKVR